MTKFQFFIFDENNQFVEKQEATLEEILKNEPIFLPNGYSYKTSSFSGLLDKNNQELFDNDIIKYESSRGVQYGIIQFSLGAFIFVPNTNKDKQYLNCLVKELIIKIGNVFENQDLLKDENETKAI